MNHDFELFVKNINDLSKNNTFPIATNLLTEQVNKLSKESLINIVREIGTIPESIEASSTEEKLYSKASDVILSRCFVELGLKSKDSFRDNYLNPALECGLIKMTLPDKPTSKNQMYYKD